MSLTKERLKQLGDEVGTILSEFEQDVDRVPKIINLLKNFDDGKAFVPSPDQMLVPVVHTEEDNGFRTIELP
jgi:hypothetical protein